MTYNQLTTEQFIERARKVHGDKYDYSKVKYVNIHTKVLIGCKKHSFFEQLPLNHLRGKGCAICSKNYRLTKEEFIKRAREVHGDKYDYSKVEYNGADRKVKIICPTHGIFEQTPYKHVNAKQGCPYCSGRISGTEMFIQKAKQVHGDKYDYSKVNYINSSTKICIICPKHGEFWQKPNSHLNGKGCRQCAGSAKLDINSIIKRAKKVHGDKYDYSKAVYKGIDEKICIICPKHGEFWQTPWNHVHGKCGCPVCKESHLEADVSNILKDLKINYERQKKFEWLKRQSLDFYLPEYNMAIECQGIQHYKPVNFGGITNEQAEKNFKHINELDESKKKICIKNNVRIAYIKYDEKELKEKIKELINNKLN